MSLISTLDVFEGYLTPVRNRKPDPTDHSLVNVLTTASQIQGFLLYAMIFES